LRQIAGQAAEKFPLQLVIIHHRVGFIAVGEPSLFLRVATSHRGEAFRASQWIVDELKKKVPIWKRPKFKVDNLRRTSHPPSCSYGVAGSEAATV
jgi:molybdopterin synthase catalytic subunit